MATRLGALCYVHCVANVQNAQHVQHALVTVLVTQLYQDITSRLIFLVNENVFQKFRTEDMWVVVDCM